MKRTQLATLALLGLVACGRAPPPPPASAPSPPAAAPTPAPGWTGLTEPLEIVEARRLLMAETERQIKAIDLFTIGEPGEPAALRRAAETIEPMLLTLPHLFPPTTNLYDPNELESPTIALPAIWDNFAAFQQMAVSAEEAAAAVASARDADALKAAARSLRSACDACHQAFTKAYAPPVVTDADRDFDFDSVLPK